MAVQAEAPARRHAGGGFDPLRWAWQLLTNVKVALLLVGLALLAGLAGVVIPQTPGPMRTNAAARAAWLELRRDDFGPLTGTMDQLGLFDVYHTAWFNGLWVLIVVAVTVCTVSRFRPTWRSVHRPQRQVAERYFETAHHRADFSHPGGAAAVEAALHRRRYRVERTKEANGAVYLFAERFGWSAYGTFVSHLALLLLLVGGLLTRLGGFDQTLVLAEGTPAAPVFATPGPDQIFVRMVDAVRGQDAAGNVVDYRSRLEVSRAGETVSCAATVNDPCSAFGYNFHQAAFFDDIGRLRVTAPDGRLLYDDVVDFNGETTAVPAFTVHGPNGELLFDQALPQMATDPGRAPGREDDAALAVLALPAVTGAAEGASFAVSWKVAGGQLRVALSGPGVAPRALEAGSDLAAGPYRIRYGGPRSIPALRVDDMPGTRPGEGAVVQMPATRDGTPYLFVAGIADGEVALTPGAPVTTAAGYTYTFAGRVEASGVNVRRDPGSVFIWIAVALALVGLGVTFYVPRRRLWVKVGEGRTWFAGVAERTTRFGRELRRMGVELGSRDALRPEDRDEPY